MYACDFGLVPLHKPAYAACPVINSNHVRILFLVSLLFAAGIPAQFLNFNF